ncbi:EpsG family protein [Mesobacillus sp. S13]|uniref:EpsG family protein n=1 Tax=Mesobacillus sp. S13 TaxID=2880221 RepID=UPI001CF5A9D7|nr:EpsG family protein [Mesobacillus sp. S13]
MFYYFLIAFLVIISQLKLKNSKANKFFSCFTTFLIVCLLVIVALVMPLRIDMVRYLGIYETNKLLSLPEAFAYVRWEPGFVTYQWVLSQISTSKYFFMTITVLIILVIIIVALKKIISPEFVPLILFGYLSLFYFYNFLSNVLRQGFAITLLLLVIVYLAKNHYKKALVFLGISLLFHVSAIIGVLLFVIKKLNISLKFLCIVFGISALLMITGINQKIMTNVAVLFGGGLEDAVVKYSSESFISLYGAVNRIDFLMFTAVWIIWGLLVYKRYLKNDTLFEWILKAYISFATIYALFGFIGFSDRLAGYAWFLIPIILFYPSIKMDTRFKFIWIMICIAISIILFLVFGTYSLYEPLKLLY